MISSLYIYQASGSDPFENLAREQVLLEQGPADGVILDKVTVELNRDATVLDQLVSAARTHNIHMENEGGVSSYISGLAYLYEFEFGELSGWMLRVNGVMADVGCGEYTLEDGDCVEWLYSLEMGADIN